ncbi:MAG TPA: hypothetical protein DD791_12510 [Syntrophomonas sp.]|nr:hypothetical protein [Syntrophomonas sp.]
MRRETEGFEGQELSVGLPGRETKPTKRTKSLLNTLGLSKAGRYNKIDKTSYIKKIKHIL